MLEIGAEFGLEQVVTKPTRKKNILDLFFTTNASLVQKSSILPGISDHDGIPVIVVNTKPQILTKKPHKTYNYSKANINAIKTELSNFSTYFTKKDNSSCSIDDMYSEFSKKIKSVMEDHVPSRLVHKKPVPPGLAGVLSGSTGENKEPITHGVNTHQMTLMKISKNTENLLTEPLGKLIENM